MKITIAISCHRSQTFFNYLFLFEYLFVTSRAVMATIIIELRIITHGQGHHGKQSTT